MFNFDVNALVSKIQPAIESVASAMGTGVAQLWTVGVTAERVKGAFELLICLFGLIGILLIPKTLDLVGEIYKEGDTYGDGSLWVLPALQAIICVPIFLGCLYGGMIKVIVPQYALVQEIVDTVNNSK